MNIMACAHSRYRAQWDPTCERWKSSLVRIALTCKTCRRPLNDRRRTPQDISWQAAQCYPADAHSCGRSWPLRFRLCRRCSDQHRMNVLRFPLSGSPLPAACGGSWRCTFVAAALGNRCRLAFDHRRRGHPDASCRANCCLRQSHDVGSRR